MAMANRFNVTLSPHQASLLTIFLDELFEWNKKINLTGLSSTDRIIKDLLIDSMIPSPFLPDHGRYLDVGSGAGFPGIPLVILKPGLEVQFVESNSKKAAFMMHVFRLLKLRQVQLINGRIEENESRLHPEGYHVITARAVAPLGQVLKWCSPHLASKGMLINFQGSHFAEALKNGEEMVSKYNLLLHKKIPYTLPGKDSPRTLLVFLKA
jgi:16S rRNA (guanine527-N7)-methyltransferase